MNSILTIKVTEIVKNLKEQNVNQNVIDDFIKLANASENDKISNEILFMEKAVNLANPVMTEAMCNLYSIHINNLNECNEEAEQLAYAVIFAKRLKKTVSSKFIIRHYDLVAIEVAMRNNELLDNQLHLQVNRINSSKHCVSGIIHLMIENGYFSIDPDKPNESIKKVLEYLKVRWGMQSIQEFYHKNRVEEYKELAKKTYPVIELLQKGMYN